MTLEHPWWATRPRCEFCVHWTYDEDRRYPLLGTCSQRSAMMSGKIVQMHIMMADTSDSKNESEDSDHDR